MEFLSDPDVRAGLLSILAMVIGYVARAKGITVPGNPLGGSTPTPAAPVPGTPTLPLDPLELFRLAVSMLRQRREERRKAAQEEDALAAFESLLPKE